MNLLLIIVAFFVGLTINNSKEVEVPVSQRELVACVEVSQRGEDGSFGTSTLSFTTKEECESKKK